MGDFGPSYMHTTQERIAVCDECGFGPLTSASSCPHCGSSTRGNTGRRAAARAAVAEMLGPGEGNGADALSALVPELLQRLVHPDLLADLAGVGYADSNPADEATLDELPTVKIEPHVLLRVVRRQNAREHAAAAAEARARRTEAERIAAEQGAACSADAASADDEFSGAGSFELRGTASAFGTHLADFAAGITGALVLADPPDASSELRNAAACRGKIVVSLRGGCSFVDKVRRVAASGALACVVVQTGAVWPFSMSDTALAGGDVELASMMVSPADGETLQQAMLGGAAGAALAGGGACGASHTAAAGGGSSSELWAHAMCHDHRTSCAVCMDELVASTLAIKLPCAHLFHPQCLREWLSKNHTCPTCRAKLPTRAEKEAKERRDDDAPPRSWSDYAVPQAGLALPSSSMYT